MPGPPDARRRRLLPPAPAHLVQHGHPQRRRVRQGHLFQERSLAGPVIFAVADGLVHHADTVAEFLARDGYEIHAYIGVDALKITAPVLFGDTLRAEAEAVELRPTKNPERFLFVYQNKAYNQRDRQVIEYRTTLMVTRKA